MIGLSKTISIAGKGGVGKSTFCALMIKSIIQSRDEALLAVDADSNATLGQMLGVQVGQTIGDLREELLKDAENIPAGMSKFEYVQYQLQLAITEGDTFDLITMGRPEGPGCYCYINNILRTYLDAAAGKYPFVVIDNEAGMEHLSRRTTQAMDRFFVISDFTPIGLETAERIRELGREMGIEIKEVYLVINRMPKDISPETNPKLQELAAGGKYKDIFYLPLDENLMKHTLEGKSLLDIPDDSTVFQAMVEVCKKASIM